MSKVSVLTPIYNHKIEYVRQCLESLMAQTMQDIEFILIDNGATQESKDLIAEFEKKDSRFRVLHIEKNEGYGKAMNLGLDNARGEYIGIVESDDWVEPNMFEDLYNFAVENNVNLVKSLYYEHHNSDYNVINNFKNIKLNKIYKITELPSFLLSHASPWSFLYKKILLDTYSIRISKWNGVIAKDLGFVIKAFLAAGEIFITNNSYYHYNIYNTNSSMKNKNTDYKLECLFNEYNDIYDWFENMTKYDKLDRSLKAFIDRRLFHNVSIRLKNDDISDTMIKLSAKYLDNHINNLLYFNNHDKKMLNNFITNINNSIFCGNIYSVRNNFANTHKIIKIFGLRIKVKKKVEELNDKTCSNSRNRL